jgi:hypothetical protein
MTMLKNLLLTPSLPNKRPLMANTIGQRIGTLPGTSGLIKESNRIIVHMVRTPAKA